MTHWQLPDLVAVVACVIAAAIDQRTRRIPNELTFVALGLGLALNGVLGIHPFVDSLLGAALMFLVFSLPAAHHFIGMGDVKLMIALGALLRWPLALPLVFHVALAGGLVAAGYAIVTRRVRQRMPYGLAIALGCLWTVASRYVDGLRVI